MDVVTTSAHLAVSTHAVLISCSSYAHRPAARRLALEVAHEPLAISQHQHLRPLALRSSIVITEVLRAGLRRFVCSGTEYLFGTALGCEYMSNIHLSTGRCPLNSFVMLRPNVGTVSEDGVLCAGDRQRRCVEGMMPPDEQSVVGD